MSDIHIRCCKVLVEYDGVQVFHGRSGSSNYIGLLYSRKEDCDKYYVVEVGRDDMFRLIVGGADVLSVIRRRVGGRWYVCTVRDEGDLRNGHEIECRLQLEAMPDMLLPSDGLYLVNSRKMFYTMVLVGVAMGVGLATGAYWTIKLFFMIF